MQGYHALCGSTPHANQCDGALGDGRDAHAILQEGEVHTFLSLDADPTSLHSL